MKQINRVSQMKTVNIFYLLIYWTQKELQNIMDDMVWWSMTHIQMCGYFIHCYATIFLHDGFNCCNGLWRHYSLCAWPGRGESVTELMPFMNLIVHSYTCCSETCITILNFHSSKNFDGFHPYGMLFFFGACCKRGRPLYANIAPSCCIPASYWHL